MPASFAGRIEDTELRPLGGARIEALWLDAFDEPRLLARAVTGDDGAYRLELSLPSEEEGVLLLRASRAGYSAAGRRVTARDPQQDFLLSAARAPVCVRVLDGRESAIAGARVQIAFEAFAGEPDRLLWLEGLTSRDGVRCFDEVPAARGTIHYAAFARALGRAEGERDKPAGAEKTEIVARLHGGLRLEGVVKRPNGDRVAGAELALMQLEGGWGERVTADDEGRVTADSAPKGAAIAIAVRGDEVLASGEAQQVIPLPQHGESFAFEVVIEPAGKIAGVVRSSSGDPVAGARVELAPSTPEDGTPRQVLADREGRFAFRGLRRGTRAMISAHHGELAPAFQHDVVASAELQLVLARGGAIAGRVIDRHGGGVPGVEVYAHRVSRRDQTELGLEEMGQKATGEDGAYRFEHLNPGEYRVEVRPRARMQWSPSAAKVFHVAVTEEGVAQVDDTAIDRGGTLQAELVLSSGEPARFFAGEVQLLPEGRGGAPHRAAVRSGNDGLLTLADLEPGKISVAIYSVEHGWSPPVVAEIADGQTSRVRLELSGVLALEGRIADARGKPVQEARVELYREDQGSQERHTVPGRAPDNFSGGRALSSEGGEYRIRGLAAGKYRLRVERDGFAPFEKSIALASSAGVSKEDVALDEGRELEVTVLDAQDRPAPGKWVLAKSARYSGSARTDEKGAAKLRALPEGRIMISAMVAGLPSREVRIGAGRLDPVQLRGGDGAD